MGQRFNDFQISAFLGILNIVLVISALFSKIGLILLIALIISLLVDHNKRVFTTTQGTSATHRVVI